jgi:RNA polymerase primary sigma factor
MESSPRGHGEDGRLISSYDTAISRRLQEQTRVVLAMLTPRERLVIRLRFGIAQGGDQPLEKISEMLTPDQVAFIEATALRKLRHPSQGVLLRSVDRR